MGADQAFVVKTLERLGVTTEPIKSLGRPPTGVGIKWDQI
jgi:hypothetical protein